MALSTAEISELRGAKRLLENPGLVAKVSNYIGFPIEAGLKRLPQSWSTAVNEVTRKSIEKALDIALLTMDRDGQEPASNWWHKLAVVASGAGGGAFGLPIWAGGISLFAGWNGFMDRKWSVGIMRSYKDGFNRI